jgi:DNA-binding LytR/AlgR family response regulator
VRIHRSVLVAVAKIDKLEKSADGKTHVLLRKGPQDDDNAPDDELVISRRHLATVRRRLKGG